MGKFKANDIAYIIESGKYIREGKILRCSGGLYLFKFTDSEGAIQVKEHRLFQLETDAQAELDRLKEESSVPKLEAVPPRRKNQYDYM